jgi:hypothetical protein
VGTFVRATAGLRLHAPDSDLFHFAQPLEDVAIHGGARRLSGTRSLVAPPTLELGVEQLQNRPRLTRHDEPTAHFDQPVIAELTDCGGGRGQMAA